MANLMQSASTSTTLMHRILHPVFFTKSFVQCLVIVCRALEKLSISFTTICKWVSVAQPLKEEVKNRCQNKQLSIDRCYKIRISISTNYYKNFLLYPHDMHFESSGNFPRSNNNLKYRNREMGHFYDSASYLWVPTRDLPQSLPW